MTINSYSIAKAIFKKQNYVHHSARRSNIVIVNNKNNIVIVKLRNARVRETYPYRDRMLFTFEAYLQRKTYGLS